MIEIAVCPSSSKVGSVCAPRRLSGRKDCGKQRMTANDITSKRKHQESHTIVGVGDWAVIGRSGRSTKLMTSDWRGTAKHSSSVAAMSSTRGYKALASSASQKQCSAESIQEPSVLSCQSLACQSHLGTCLSSEKGSPCFELAANSSCCAATSWRRMTSMPDP